jgi:hypothetical protein
MSNVDVILPVVLISLVYLIEHHLISYIKKLGLFVEPREECCTTDIRDQ